MWIKEAKNTNKRHCCFFSCFVLDWGTHARVHFVSKIEEFSVIFCFFFNSDWCKVADTFYVVQTEREKKIIFGEKKERRKINKSTSAKGQKATCPTRTIDNTSNSNLRENKFTVNRQPTSLQATACSWNCFTCNKFQGKYVLQFIFYRCLMCEFVRVCVCEWARM